MISELIKENNAQVEAISWQWQKGPVDPTAFALQALLINHLLSTKASRSYITTGQFAYTETTISKYMEEWLK